MDDDERETYYTIRRLKNENKPENLHHKLQQYIRLDKEQQRVEKFGQEMYKTFMTQLKWRQTGDSRFSLGQALKAEASLVTQIGDAKQDEQGTNLSHVDFNDKMVEEWLARIENSAEWANYKRRHSEGATAV